MKKLLALCLTLVLLTNCAITAFATEDTCSGSGETEIFAHLYSSYSIVIPAAIDFGSSQEIQSEVMLINAYIESGYKVDVYATNFNQNGGITLTNVDNSMYEITCMLTNREKNTVASLEIPLVTFYDTDVSFGTSTNKYYDLTIVHNGVPGQYVGTMTYSFSCSPYEQG